MKVEIRRIEFGCRLQTPISYKGEDLKEKDERELKIPF
jgi:hypothetical protein